LKSFLTKPMTPTFLADHLRFSAEYALWYYDQLRALRVAGAASGGQLSYGWR
jgi:hypothetical protein